MSPELIAVLGLTLVLAFATVLAAVRIAGAVREVAGELRALEARHEQVRRALDDRLYRLAVHLEAQTAAVRETAEQAPEAVITQRNELAAGLERLTRAVHDALAFTPDPAAGPYAAAGAEDAMGHVRHTLRAAL